VEAVPYSTAELELWRPLVDAAAGAAAAVTGGEAGAGFTVGGEAWTISMNPLSTDAIDAAVDVLAAAGVPTDAFAFKYQPLLTGGGGQHNGPTDYWRGGLDIMGTGSGWISLSCITGPTFHRDGNQQEAFVSTAGHCHDGAGWKVNGGTGKFIGNTCCDWFNGVPSGSTIVADAEYVRVTSSTIQDDIIGRYDVIYEVVGALPQAAQYAGSEVCAHIRHKTVNGEVIQRSCGPIYDSNKTFYTYDDEPQSPTYLHRQYMKGNCVNYRYPPPVDGDSGGAVYRVYVNGEQVHAAGIHSNDIGCYSTAANINANSSLTLWVNPFAQRRSSSL
jgi:hypothetical protein